jgi:uncharacterized membrane protein
MNVIDHAILISASPTFIWRFLGDISQNPKWQDDCTNISFLTTQHDGKGARWRYSTPKGKDVVVEITAWYDTLGYEYIIVDGGSVGENKGRVRLQEIAEGTLVQWTFNYEVEGAFSGLRNSMGLKRNLSNNIQDSLRNLYKLIQTETGGIPTHEAKALLKEAPDVEERSSYEPRHPSSIQDKMEEAFAEPDYPSEQPISYNIQGESIIEPPVADDDTKPNPVVQGTEEITVPTDIAEPSFLQGIPEPPIATDDTEPNAPITDDEIATDSTPDNSSETKVDEVKATSQPIETPVESKSTRQPERPITTSPDVRDTATVSVFDIFGLQKPSQTQEIRALSDEELKASGIKPVVPVPSVQTNDTIAEDVPDTPEEITEPPVIEPEEEASDIQDIKAVEVNEVETAEKVTEVALQESTEIKFDEENQPNIIDPQVSPSFIQIAGFRLMTRRKIIQVRNRK